MITRRDLLAGTALLASLPRQALAGEVDAREALLALLPDRNAAASLGATWIQHEPQQPGAVLQSLQQRLGVADARKMRDAIAEDFRNGAIVKIEGWQIARTQAELCALAYFAAAGSL